MYSPIQERLLPLKHIGSEGVEKLSSATVAVVGAGGTGSHHIEMMARLGVKRIIILDGDVVDETNLGRQALYTFDDVGKPKAHRAADAARSINPNVDITSHFTDLKPSTLPLLNGADIILDGTDNIHTRRLINEYAVENNLPWIYCGAVATEYMSMPVVPGRGPCFNCILPEDRGDRAPTCAEAGVMEPAVAVASSLAVTMAVRALVLGEESLLDEKGRAPLVHGDVWHRSQEEVMVLRDAKCSICVGSERPAMESTYPSVRALCGGGFEVTVPGTIDLDELGSRYDHVELRSVFALMKSGDATLTVYPSGRIKVTGVQNEKAALRIVRETLGY